MKKRLGTLALAALLCVVLAACSVSNETTDTATEEAATDEIVLNEEIEEVTEETEETEETAVAAGINPLTGESGYSEDAAGNRPVAVMVNNVSDALPQYGVGEADVVFEIPLEGYLTRLLCVYPDYESVPYIVSVRSYRYYYAAISCGFDAIYIHWGQDNSMMDYYNSLDMDSYNGMDGGTLFGRDSDRQAAGYSTEHTSYFDGTKLASVMEEDGMRTTVDDAHAGTAFNFNSGDSVVSAGDESASEVSIAYGATTANLTYDEETQTYLKFFGSKEQVDGSTGEQLSFTNVIILETEMSVRDEKGHLDMDITGVSGKAGYYISGGTATPITWSKDDEYSQFVFYDADGNELELNCGKTYIGITRADTYTIE